MRGEGGGLIIRHLKTSFAGNSWPSAVDIPEKASPTMTSDNDFRSGVQVLYHFVKSVCKSKYVRENHSRVGMEFVIMDYKYLNLMI